MKIFQLIAAVMLSILFVVTQQLLTVLKIYIKICLWCAKLFLCIKIQKCIAVFFSDKILMMIISVFSLVFSQFQVPPWCGLSIVPIGWLQWKEVGWVLYQAIFYLHCGRPIIGFRVFTNSFSTCESVSDGWNLWFFLVGLSETAQPCLEVAWSIKTRRRLRRVRERRHRCNRCSILKGRSWLAFLISFFLILNFLAI